VGRLVMASRTIETIADVHDLVVELAFRCSSHACRHTPASAVVLLDGPVACHGGPWMACAEHVASLSAGNHDCVRCGEHLAVLSVAGLP